MRIVVSVVVISVTVAIVFLAAAMRRMDELALRNSATPLEVPWYLDYPPLTILIVAVVAAVVGSLIAIVVHLDRQSGE